MAADGRALLRLHTDQVRQQHAQECAGLRLAREHYRSLLTALDPGPKARAAPDAAARTAAWEAVLRAHEAWRAAYRRWEALLRTADAAAAPARPAPPGGPLADGHGGAAGTRRAWRSGGS